MEEKSNLTAERSLEIITEQLERSRQTVARHTGQTLYISGLCLMGWALLIGLCICFTKNAAFYLLYILLPLVIYVVDRYVNRKKPKVPDSFVGSISILFNKLMLHDALVADNMQVYFQNRINPVRIIYLMMGMVITINGYTLKSRWMVWCGIIGGIGGFFWEAFCMTETLTAKIIYYTNSNYFGIINGIFPSMIIAVFAFIGLTLPGWMMKKK